MRVKNLTKTSKKRCFKCESWLAHWKNLTGLKASKCVKKGCINDATLGAHIKQVGDIHAEHIVPLCHHCNALDGEFELKVDIDSYLATTTECK